MKKFLLLIALFLFSTATVLSQEQSRNFNTILHNYYLVKDKDLVEKTVDFANHTTIDIKRLEPILKGFFGALYLDNSVIKNEMAKNLNNITNIEIRKLLSDIASSNIDSLYSAPAPNTIYNDMNWSSYFATGKTKYLDLIIANIPHVDERVNLDLFLAGATAQWSLCANAHQHDAVKQYLMSLGDKNKHITETLNHEQAYFKAQMTAIIKEQKAKGIWN